MKTIILSLFVISLSVFTFSPTVLAASVFNDCYSGTATSTQLCQATQTGSGNPIIQILKTTINVISYILGIAAVIVLIIAGLQMIISGSDAQAVATARNMMIYALVGIVVAVLAQTIVLFVLDRVK